MYGWGLSESDLAWSSESSFSSSCRDRFHLDGIHVEIYSHDQNYWRITDFFTKSSNRSTHMSNSMVWGISPQPGHFFSFQLAHFIGHALPHLPKQTAINRSQNCARQTDEGNCG